MRKKLLTAFSLIEVSIVILIIGLLITAIAHGSKMVNKAKLNSARLATTSLGIDKIPNMTFWVETTLEDSLTSPTHQKQVEDNDQISAWADLNPSAIKYNLSQDTAGYRPLYSADAMKGLPALKFDGSNDYFLTNNLTGRDFTLFIILKTSNNGAGTSSSTAFQSTGVIWSDAIGYGVPDIIPLAIGGGKPKIASPSDDTLTGTISVSDGRPHIVTVSRMMYNGVRSIYVDGTSGGSNTGGTGQLLANTTMAIGGNTLDSRYFDGHIGEIIIYDRVLKLDERKAVEDYLSKKWQITAS
jgi:type II secretory pathway pseudopilin PulG